MRRRFSVGPAATVWMILDVSDFHGCLVDLRFAQQKALEPATWSITSVHSLHFLTNLVSFEGPSNQLHPFYFRFSTGRGGSE